MSYRLKELDKEILTLLSNKPNARWTDLKHDLPKRLRDQYSGTGFDVVLSRALKRLRSLDLVYRLPEAREKRGSYMLTPYGSAVATRLRYGLTTLDVSRDRILAFSLMLQYYRYLTIVHTMGDSLEDYFRTFKGLLNRESPKRLLEDLKVYEQLYQDPADPLDLKEYLEPWENLDPKHANPNERNHSET